MPPNIYEPYRAVQWLRSVLNPLAAGGAWRGMAPPTMTITPFTVYTPPPESTDVTVIGGIRIMNDGLYTIKACGPGTDDAAVYALADANDDALTRKGGINVGSDGLILSCVREGGLDYDELVNGMSWINVGGLYRIRVQAR